MNRVWDDRVCALGEGPLWHPERSALFWFDILGRRLLTAGRQWVFPEMVSAAGWVDRNTLLIAFETALRRFDIETGTHEVICPLEADNLATRSNDGRADPWGGFWIGTMDKNEEPEAGAIYRFWRGQVHRLYDRITVSNAICFSPDRRFAYFTDTHTRLVMRQPLDPQEGWPEGAPAPFIDLRKDGTNPDGAVVDAAGNIWIALWGASKIICHDSAGRYVQAVGFDATQTSCPAFGGADLTSLFCTSAATGLDCQSRPYDGCIFIAEGFGPGQPEHRVKL